MFYHLIFCYLSAIWFVTCFTSVDEDLILQPDIMNDEDIENFFQRDMVKHIERFEDVALRSRQSVEGTSQENSTELYDEMTAIVQGMIDLNVNPNNAEKFLRAKGLSRVVAPNLRIAHAPLRRQLLILTRQLFDISPRTVNVVVPLSILDNILDIFEHDDSLSAKAYALDVLSAWLPGNPKAQTRVMKLKGLEPFYDQISKLDMTVLQNLLELFNKILEEHIAVRGEGRMAFSAQHRTFYQQIGLLEHLSTRRVCDGLLNIFEKALPVLPHNDDMVLPLLELVRKIEPFCLKTYKGKRKPQKVFTDLMDFFIDSEIEQRFRDEGLDASHTKEILDKYVNELKTAVRDEL